MCRGPSCCLKINTQRACAFIQYDTCPYTWLLTCRPWSFPLHKPVTRIRLCGHGCGQDGCGKGAHAACQVRGQVDSTVGHGAQEVRISHSGSSSFTVSALNKPSSSFPSSSSSSGVSLPQERSTAEQVFYNLVARSRVCVRTRTHTHIHTYTHI